MDTHLKTETASWPHNWPHLANLLIGLWLIVAPLVLGFGSYFAAASTFVCFGLMIAMFAAYALIRPETWEEGINLVLGLCLAASPWFFAFTTERALVTHALIAGAAVMAIAVWSIMRNMPGDHWWHHPRPH